MDIIQLLPDYVANQIAAGEVIQRPASVVKELVENAIDAGAKTIKVFIVDAGRTSIQVIDDGCGMSDTDARLSFERHATSKIAQFSDLAKLHTMGFRGEALASIAAVAQVTLQTRRKEEELGTCLKIAGSSNVTSQEEIACAPGSNFNVENLFYNVPARRKFLKSDKTEMKNINETFERIALVYPNVKFELYQNGQPVMVLPATTQLQRIVDFFGKKINKSLLPIEDKTTICGIRGYVGKPESSKKSGAPQFFFVNGRFMKHPYFHKAIQKAVERLIPSGEQIPYFIFLTVDPEDIDVNIHPVKTEIKFTNEQAIWQLLLANVQNAIGQNSSVTELEFDTEGRPDIPVFNPENLLNVTQPTWEVDTDYNPFAEGKETGEIPMPSSRHSSAAPKYNPSQAHSIWGNTRSASLGVGAEKAANQAGEWEKLYEGIREANAPHTHTIDLFPSESVEGNSSTSDGNETIGSLLAERSHEYLLYCGKYIVTQTPVGLVLIDQHRADAQIRYEEYMKSGADNATHVQRMLFPEIVSFPQTYSEQIESIVADLSRLGFEITDMGGMSYQLSGYPAGLDGLDPVRLVTELVDSAVNRYSKVEEEVNAILAEELAEKAAIPYGQVLSSDEMDDLVDRLLQCKSFLYTYNGKPITATIQDSYIGSLF